MILREVIKLEEDVQQNCYDISAEGAITVQSSY